MLEAVSRPTPQAADCAGERRLEQAATDFEALLVAQLLKAARGEGGWMGTGEDQAAASMLELAEEHLAAVIAAGGGLGLKGLLIEGLRVRGCAGAAGVGER